MKKCPICNKKQEITAIKCKNCGEDLEIKKLQIRDINFGVKIKILRKQQNMTQKRMAKISGVQPAILSKIENNKAMGHIRNYIGIAKALNLRLSELFAHLEQI